MTAAATPADIAPRPIPVATGKVQLVIGRPTDDLTAACAAKARRCYVATDHTTTPSWCHDLIRQGEFYLLYRPSHPSNGTRGKSYRYCAPCAVREWAHRGVHEEAGKRS